jgi:hypothetical protein
MSETTTPETTASEPAPAIREDVVNSITPAEFIELHRRITARYADRLPFPLRQFHFSISTNMRDFAFHGYIGYKIHSGYSRVSFDEAFEELKTTLDSTERMAAQKREQAAKLIAEAEMLEKTNQPDPKKWA